MVVKHTRALGPALLTSLAALAFVACGEPPSSKAPPPPEAAEKPSEPAPDVPEKSSPLPPPAPSSENPLDLFINKASSYLASTQAEDGSWPYFHSQTPDFAAPEPHVELFGTMMTLTNMAGTELEASPMFERGASYIASKRRDGNTWALYDPDTFSNGALFEPDADDTAVALTLLSGRIVLQPKELQELRALFDRYLTQEGLYRTYFDGVSGEKGFVPDRNDPSIGVNVNVLGFFGKYQLDRARLSRALEAATRRERYWENTPFYRSLPVLAHLASNALENGAPEAESLLRRFLSDFAASEAGGEGYALRLSNLELAAYVKARSQLCLIERTPCRDLDMTVFELAKRRKQDGSWSPAAIYDYDTNPDALLAFVERRDFAAPRDRGGVGYDVERALKSTGALHYYDGSRPETTSFALKALVLYRKLLQERPAFGAGS